jgi:hypothetical protein
MRQRFPRWLSPMLGWIGIYFEVFSLMVLALVMVINLLQPAETGMEAIGAGIYVVFSGVALINLGIGGGFIMASQWLKQSATINATLLPEGFMRRRRRAIASFFLASVLYLVTGLGGMVSFAFLAENWQDWYFSWNMPAVQIGDSRQQVERVVGRGDSRWDCNSQYAKDYSMATDLKTCVEVSIYPYRSPHATRSQWEIAYDKGDRVVSKKNAVFVVREGKFVPLNFKKRPSGFGG